MTKRQLLPSDTPTRSRALRKEAGEPELRLWRALREASPEAKFRRQVPLGRYHADFCSHSVKLIVEIDGDDHATRQSRDAARTRFLEDEGYHVVRVANAEVMENIEGVLTVIGIALSEQRKGRP